MRRKGDRVTYLDPPPPAKQKASCGHPKAFDPSATPSRAMTDVLRHDDSPTVLRGPDTVIKAFDEGPSRWQVQREVQR